MRQDNGFFRCRALDAAKKKDLISFFRSCGFSALNFTDSRSCYQFYNLSFLWRHIQKALEYGIKKLNITSEPVSAGDLYESLEGKPFVNELAKPPFDYDLRSKHAKIFSGKNGYLFDKTFVVEDIKRFVEASKREEFLI